MIQKLLWPDDRIEHIGRHGVTPEEFEEVCFGHALVLRRKAEGVNPVYHVLGQTSSGKYLLCIVIGFPDGNGYPVTARNMTTRERQRYRRWKSK